jgi:hypothetical protein
MVAGIALNLEDKELDAYVYRIMKQEYAYSLFSDSQNVLVQPKRWKDKFENFQLQLGGVLDGEKFEYGFKDDFCGQCWTSDYLSEAMWGIYANDPKQRYLRVRSTPRKLLESLAAAHPEMPQETCFVGKVDYKNTSEIEKFIKNGSSLELSSSKFAQSLLIKRSAFEHESEVRLLFFGDSKKFDTNGLYRYKIDPHNLITQIMADPNRGRSDWAKDKAEIASKTGFKGEIKRSKIYDPPDWSAPEYKTT